MEFQEIDFSTLPIKKRRAIISRSIEDMTKLAIARKKEGLPSRGFNLQFNNVIQVAKLNYEDN